jgi:glycosyltransferase involved in cell wall biosynthesis
MRVAYVCADPGVPVFGEKGSSIHVQEMLRALKSRGCRVELFAARVDGAPPPGLEALPLHRLPRLSASDAAAREREALAANVPLRRTLAEAGRFDVVYERYSLWSHAAMEHARDAGTPGVLEVNAPLVEEQATYRTLADREGAERVARQVFAAARALVAVSDGVASYLRAQGAAPERVHVVPNGVDPARFPESVLPSRPADPGVFTVGFVGTLKAWHGLPQLAEAFHRLHDSHPATRLLIVGDGPEREDLVRDLAARGLSGSALLCGAVPPAEIPGLLASMDAAVAPYPPIDPFYFSPLKVFEYMAAGLPVAASRIGQLAAVIRDGGNGLLLPPGDAGALSAALVRLCEDRALRIRLGRAARGTVLEEHTWEAVAGRILRLAGLQPSSAADHPIST